MKIYICKCEQCKFVKNKRKNRKLKNIIKKLINKKRRKGEIKYYNYYWA